MKANWRKIWITALALGWLVDILFWERGDLATWTLYIWIVFGVTLALMHFLEVRPHRNIWILMGLAALLNLITMIRLEPMSVGLAILSSLLLFFMAVTSFKQGHWTHWTFLDYLYNLLAMLVHNIGAPLAFIVKVRKETQENENKRKLGWPIFRGLLLALPIVLFFTLLLSQADPVFAEQVKRFLALFRLEYWPEYLFRLFYILMVAYFLIGLWLYAAFKSENEKVTPPDKRPLKPFLGAIEGSIVLGSVVALFAAFVLVQFRYFFGGLENIAIDGFTYAEYARRGFGELVGVAIISFAFLLFLEAIVRLLSAESRRVFLGLSFGMIAEVVIMLISAFQRLRLYEQAYGYTRLRIYTHVFMVWLGLLLVAFAVLLWRQRTARFAFFALLASLGFIVSLAVLNVDGFIVRQNVTRAQRGETLDGEYLIYLTADAVPALAQFYQADGLDAAAHDAIGAALMCITERDDLTGGHFARVRARRWLDGLDLSGYQMDAYNVTTPLGESYFCGLW